jgi:hypothetical protein
MRAAPRPLALLLAIACLGGCGARTGLVLDGTADAPPSPPATTPARDAGADASVAPPACGVEPDVVALSLADDTSCALRRDGSVWCWGSDANGQLGTGASRARPVRVAGLPPLVTLSCRPMLGCCGAAEDGSIACWGHGPTKGAAFPPPTKLGGSRRAIAIVPGILATCALVSGEGVVCWTQSEKGGVEEKQLEDSATAASLVVGDEGVSGFVRADGVFGAWSFPVSPKERVASVIEVVHVAAGAEHVCAAIPGGGLSCWGNNGYGQLGATPPPTKDAYAGTPTPEPPIAGGADLALGGYMSCQRTTSGELFCWGENDQGQLGYDDPDDTLGPLPEPTPHKVEGLPCVIAAAAARHHACAITSEGVSCWGRNLDGELGDGTTESRSTPRPVVW